MNMPIQSSSQSTVVKNKRETEVKSGVFLELNRSVAELHIHHSTEAGLTRYPPIYQTQRFYAQDETSHWRLISPSDAYPLFVKSKVASAPLSPRHRLRHIFFSFARPSIRMPL